MTLLPNYTRRARKVSAAALVALNLMACAGTVPSPSTPPEPTGEVITLTPQPGRLVLSGIQQQPGTLQTVTLENLGSTPVQIDSLNVVGSSAADFTVESAPPLPFTLAGGGRVNVAVRLAAKTSVSRLGDVLRATLQARGTGTMGNVAISALRAFGLEGDNEPTLANIVDALGYTVNVGWKAQTTDIRGSTLGDQVSAPLFVRASTEPVTLVPVARYSPDGSIPAGYYKPGTSGPQRTTTETLVAGSYQQLNPSMAGSQAFDPGSAAFGIFIDPRNLKTPYPLTHTQDGLNTDPTAHSVRTYPLRDAQGALVANAYILCFEPGTNGDYQDAVFELRNVKPAP